MGCFDYLYQKIFYKNTKTYLGNKKIIISYYAENYVEKRCNLGLDGGSFIPVLNRKIRENHLSRKMF